MEKPLSMLSVSKENVIAAYTEQMDPQEFINSLVVEDRRPAQSIYFDELYQARESRLPIFPLTVTNSMSNTYSEPIR